jgi:hypothetical protein
MRIPIGKGNEINIGVSENAAAAVATAMIVKLA